MHLSTKPNAHVRVRTRKQLASYPLSCPMSLPSSSSSLCRLVIYTGVHGRHLKKSKDRNKRKQLMFIANDKIEASSKIISLRRILFPSSVLVPQHLKPVEIGADDGIAQCLASHNKMCLILEEPHGSRNQYFLKGQDLSMLRERAPEGVRRSNGWLFKTGQAFSLMCLQVPHRT